ncbi:hypothetical protein [uncultured Veillonella sp.]|jgi:hypothetical protein|uniref:hypothetical protein n=1 Tax=uncultured Veillonella sp. TaxID=159268 RepID=UPI0025910D95|nr:hypothetical protein [uncultured Veillonella sp.]
MITKQLSFKADSTLSDTIDTTSNTTTIPADEATNTNTHFSYASPTGSLLVHEDVIDYETQLALREKWRNLTITDNFLFEKVMHSKRVYA